MKVAYWPGCVSRGFTPELHGAMAKVAPLLDIELVELDRAACCGAGVIAEHNQELADTLNARTFALAQRTEGELMMNICSTCQGAQSECQQRLDSNTAYRELINGNLTEEGLTYEKDPAHPLTNKNFLWLLVEEMGLDALKARVKRPLTELRVGPFYGCYIVRPVDRLGIDEQHPRDRHAAQATVLGTASPRRPGRGRHIAVPDPPPGPRGRRRATANRRREEASEGDDPAAPRRLRRHRATRVRRSAPRR